VPRNRTAVGGADVTDYQLISEHRQKRVAQLERAIEDVLAADYIVVPCECGGDPVREMPAKFCGECGRRLVTGGG
jgi:hypothetical protein